ncbi:MAG: hypothetical protein RJB66_935 [Pseudomonadota bacterium]
MIFPFWLHINQFLRAPVTMMFLVLNVFIFLVLPMKNGINLSAELTQKVSKKDFITVHSYLYEQYLKSERPKDWSLWLERFYQNRNELQGGEINDFWYQMSFRDGAFLGVVKTLSPYPDEVRYNYWKKVFTEFENFQKKDFAGVFGVSINGFRWSHYITYQFVHASFFHLFSNMIILVLFGVLIEIQLGSGLMLFLYLVGGAFGGLFYSITTGNNLAPLVGASGSVSTLITFLLLTEPRRHLRFFYFFVPSKDYFGDIYLSKYWLIPMLILGDINAILTTPEWNLGVAHTAHLGAILFGSIVGVFYRSFMQKSHLSQTLSWVSHPEEADEGLVT